MVLNYGARFLVLAGAIVLGVSLFLHTAWWLIGTLLVVVALFLFAIAIALRLPP